MGENETLTVHPCYQTAHAQITQPTRFVTVSQYYRRRWLKHVGPVGTAILLELRGRCYNNPQTGERRDVVVIAQRDLAEAVGISVDTLQRQLGKPGRGDDGKANPALRRFLWTEEQYERGVAGRVRQLENIYHVSLDDPIHPDDEAEFQRLVLAFETEDAASRTGPGLGRKNIKNAPPPEPLVASGAGTEKSVQNSCGGAPEPQNAVLRHLSPPDQTPEPQNAVGGHRKMRQGSPQNAARIIGDSLPFITGISTSLTFNVEDGIQCSQHSEPNSVIEPDSVPSAPAEPLVKPIRSPRMRALDELVTALVEELRDYGSERRHFQLLDICQQHVLDDLPRQALTATRRRLASEQKLGVLEKPGAYYQHILIALLEDHQIFVPRQADGDPDEIRQLICASLGVSVNSGEREEQK